MNKKTNKIAAVIMLGTVLLSNNVYAKNFSDVDKTGGYKWAYKAVNELSNKKILGGYPDGSFKPERPVSFLEIMQIIKNIKSPSDKEIKAANKAFGDVTKKYNVPSWAEEAVNYNLYKNIITEKTLSSAHKRGFLKDKGLVFPDRNSVTVYFGRAFGFNGTGNIKNLKHKDLDKVPQATKGYLSQLVDANIYSSTGSEGYFNGKRFIKRAEVAVIADKALVYLESSDNKKDEKIETGDLTAGLVDDIKTIEGKIDFITLSGEESTIKIDNNKYRIRVDTVIISDLTNSYNKDILSLQGASVRAEIKENEVIKLIIKDIKEKEQVIIEEPKYDDENTESLVNGNNHSEKENEVEFSLSGRVLNSKSTDNGYEVEIYVIVSDTKEFVAGQEIIVDSNKKYYKDDIVNIKGIDVDGEIKELRII